MIKSFKPEKSEKSERSKKPIGMDFNNVYKGQTKLEDDIDHYIDPEEIDQETTSKDKTW